MQPILQYFRREQLWPYVAAFIALLVLLPGIWSFGFWEPQEINVADRARERNDTYTVDEISRATAKHFRVNMNVLKGGRPAGAKARSVAAFLARRHTSKSFNALRRAYGIPTTKAAREAVAEVDTNANLQADVDAVEIALRALGPKRAKKKPTGPPLTEILVAHGIDMFGPGEFGARLPLVALGLITILCTFFIGVRLASPRAGLMAVLVLISFPLFLFQARQITSNIGAVAGQSMMMLGLIGQAWPRPNDKNRHWLMPLDALLVALGAFIAYYAAAAFLGVFVPLGAVGLAGAIALVSERRASDSGNGPAIAQAITSDQKQSKLQLWIITLAAAAAAVATLAWVFSAVFDLKSPVPGDRALFGKAVHSSADYIEALGGVWRKNGNLAATFDGLFEQLAYGLFPWVALAPIAVAHLAMGARSGRRAWAGYIVFAWALLAWVVATIMMRKVGPVHYPALAAVALAVAMWLDDLLCAREHADAVHEDDEANQRRVGLSLRMPLAGLFAATCAIVLAKDLQPFTIKLMNVHMSGGSGPTYPAALKMKAALLGFALLFGLALAIGLGRWSKRNDKAASGWSAPLYLLGRHGVTAALTIGVVFALFLSHYWTPKLSSRLSSKDLFAAYESRATEDDRLGLMGNHGSAPDYYIDTDYQDIRNRGELLTFLKVKQRSFAIVQASELCAVHRASAGAFNYHVLYDENARFLLMSNQLGSGDRDRNPLLTAITRKRPDNIENPLNTVFDNKIELIGYNMPRKVGSGEKFKMTLFFKVLANVGGGAWKIFVHFDGRGMRFQGDHSPIRGRCTTGFWQKGDYIIDEFEVEAGGMTYPKGNYGVLMGFFYGSHGNWRNMSITRGPKDNAKRARIGNITVGSKRGGCSLDPDGSGSGTGILVLIAVAGLVWRRRGSSLPEQSGSSYDPGSRGGR